MVCTSNVCLVRGQGQAPITLGRTSTFSAPNPAIKSAPMTGVRCPTCAANGQESWVIPGRACGYCGTGC
ncbi:hypothetical protein LSUE1_G006356 [Lachnellula suecica]|uniref:Uncharacterized protein n=1 Tax=Lachnellula suecica TaxID=602035 RepID=A0A8T9C8L1_9HELO|nr:hypothetical protein LSUE1_G006356 [Lachnellula suecica]